MERNTDSSKLKNNTTRPKPTITTTEKEDLTLIQYGYNVDMYGKLQTELKDFRIEGLQN